MAICLGTRDLVSVAFKTSGCLSNLFLQHGQCACKFIRPLVLCSKKLVPPKSCQIINQQICSTHKNSVATVSLLNTVWDKITFRSGRKVSKSVLQKSALKLYLCSIELVSHDTFIREFHLPDTFNSWFRITELHLWLMMLRLSDEGKDGQMLRNMIIEFMWLDIDKKTKKLGELATLTARKEGMLLLSEQFKAALFNYDEGLIGDDKQLAGALWRNFFDRNCECSSHLERMVEYVRKQVSHLDRYPSEEILNTGIMEFTPLVDNADMRARNKLILVQILKRI